MTQIDISTPAIIARCEHIEHCALGGRHKDAQRMRALVAERNTLANQVEDCARTCSDQAEKIRALTGQLAEARNAALEEALASARQECPIFGPEGPTDLAHEAVYETAGGIIAAIDALKSTSAEGEG